MTPQAKQNIQDSFDANPKADILFTNEHGHCWLGAGEGLTPITRADLLKEDEAEVTEGNEKTPEEMTVAELKQALSDLAVEFNAKALKPELVALLVEAKQPKAE